MRADSSRARHASCMTWLRFCIAARLRASNTASSVKAAFPGYRIVRPRERLPRALFRSGKRGSGPARRSRRTSPQGSGLATIHGISGAFHGRHPGDQWRQRAGAALGRPGALAERARAICQGLLLREPERAALARAPAARSDHQHPGQRQREAARRHRFRDRPQARGRRQGRHRGAVRLRPHLFGRVPGPQHSAGPAPPGHHDRMPAPALPLRRSTSTRSISWRCTAKRRQSRASRRLRRRAAIRSPDPPGEAPGVSSAHPCPWPSRTGNLRRCGDGDAAARRSGRRTR